VTVHAFVDESTRNRRYLMAVAVVDPSNLRTLRRDLCGLLLPGQRELHFYREKPARRRQLADVIARMPVEVHVYSCGCDRYEEPARRQCLTRLTEDLLKRSAHRLVIDSRQNKDVHDERTLRRVLGPYPRSSELAYEHVDSASEALLWIADITAWCHGAGGDWRRRVSPVIAAIIDVD
jgi:hypothetical protein